MPWIPVSLPSAIGLLGLTTILAILSTSIAKSSAPTRPFAISASIWASAVLLVAEPLLDISQPISISLLLGHTALQILLVVVIATLRYQVSAIPGTGRVLAIAAWLLLLFSYTPLLLAALQPGTLLLAIGGILLAGFLLVYVAVALVHPLTHRIPTAWLRSGAALVMLLGVISPFLNSKVEIAVDEIGGQATGVAAISTGRPSTPHYENVESGITTTGFGKSDPSLSFAVSGLITASKPNFHQVITLRIRAQIGHSRQQVLRFEAYGVPQPDGSLALLHSQLSLHAAIPHLVGGGQATHVLADAIFGSLRLHRQSYSFLLSYTPVGLHNIHGTLTLWPSGLAVEPTVLD